MKNEKRSIEAIKESLQKELETKDIEILQTIACDLEIAAPNDTQELITAIIDNIISNIFLANGEEKKLY